MAFYSPETAWIKRKFFIYPNARRKSSCLHAYIKMACL